MDGADFFFTAFSALLSIVTIVWMIVYVLRNRDPDRSFIAWLWRTIFHKHKE